MRTEGAMAIVIGIVIAIGMAIIIGMVIAIGMAMVIDIVIAMVIDIVIAMVIGTARLFTRSQPFSFQRGHASDFINRSF